MNSKTVEILHLDGTNTTKRHTKTAGSGSKISFTHKEPPIPNSESSNLSELDGPETDRTIGQTEDVLKAFYQVDESTDPMTQVPPSVTPVDQESTLFCVSLKTTKKISSLERADPSPASPHIDTRRPLQPMTNLFADLLETARSVAAKQSPGRRKRPKYTETKLEQYFSGNSNKIAGENQSVKAAGSFQIAGDILASASSEDEGTPPHLVPETTPDPPASVAPGQDSSPKKSLEKVGILHLLRLEPKIILPAPTLDNNDDS